VQNRHAIRKVLSHIQQLSRIDDRSAASRSRKGFALEIAQRQWIHARGQRFVQEPQLRIDQQKCRKSRLVDLTARERADRFTGQRQKIEFAQNVHGPIRCRTVIAFIQAHDDR